MLPEVAKDKTPVWIVSISAGRIRWEKLPWRFGCLTYSKKWNRNGHVRAPWKSSCMIEWPNLTTQSNIEFSYFSIITWKRLLRTHWEWRDQRFGCILCPWRRGCQELSCREQPGDTLGRWSAAAQLQPAFSQAGQSLNVKIYQRFRITSSTRFTKTTTHQSSIQMQNVHILLCLVLNKFLTTFPKLPTSKMKSSLVCGDNLLVSVWAFQRGRRASTILLCSCRKSVCMDVRVGWTIALESPLVRSSGVGLGFGTLVLSCGLPKPHCPRLGKASLPLPSPLFWVFSRAPGTVEVLPFRPGTWKCSLSPLDVSASEP